MGNWMLIRHGVNTPLSADGVFRSLVIRGSRSECQSVQEKAYTIWIG